MNCTWNRAVPGAFLLGLQVPKASLKESRDAFLWDIHRMIKVQAVPSEIKEQSCLSAGSPGRNKSSELFPGVLKQELAAERPAGWICWAGAAPWSPGTAGEGHWHHLLHFGGLLMPWVLKLRWLGRPGQPGFCFLFALSANWMKLLVGFTSLLSLHCTTAQQGQACPNSELHPSGVEMFGVWAVLEMSFVKLK